MKSLKQVLFIALKDLKIFGSQRSVLFSFIVFPFLFIILFNYLMGSAVQQDKRLELHLVTQETGGFSRQILDTLETKDDSKLKPGEPKLIWDSDYARDLQAVRDRQLDGFVAFSADFTKGILMGYGAKLEVVVDPEATNTRPALNGLADAIAASFNLQQTARNAMNGLVVEQGLANPNIQISQAELAQLTASVQQGIQIKSSLIKFGVEKVGEVESLNPSNFVIPGYLVMFVFMGAATATGMIVRARQNNTLERLMASSVTRGTLLGGIFAGTAAKGLVQIIIFWGVGILVFKMDMGVSPAAVIILSVLMVFTSAAFALMLATFVKTARSAASIAVLASLVMAPLGGCWWPLFVTPKWMQEVALITPHGWANEGFNKLMVFGGDFSSVMPEMLALTAFTVVFLIIANIRFRTDAE